jgi:type IV pilus assembly protein PilE
MNSVSRLPLASGSVRRLLQGFTLIELMIVVAVIALLSMIAFPSYMDSVRKSRRSEAVAALSAVQQAQERWRSNCPTYATDAQLPQAAAASAATMCTGAVGLALSRTTSEGRYTLQINNPTAAGYTVTATAVAGKGQTSDKAQGVSCTPLTLAASAGNWSAAPTQCWSR